MAEPLSADVLLSNADERAAAILRSLSRRFRAPPDGEQRKTLAKIYGAILAAQELETKGVLHEPQRSMIGRLLETDATKLHLDALLALMDVWDRTLIETRDATYLRGLLRVEINRSREEPPTSVVTLDNAIPLAADMWSYVLADGAMLRSDQCERASNQLFELYRLRTSSYQLQRARGKLSTELLRRATLVVALAVALLAGALLLLNPIGIAAASGALGGCISAAKGLRAAPRQLGALRALKPLILLQPFVGAAAGLVVYMLLSTGATGLLNAAVLNSRNEWAVTGLVAFVAGFAEPQFIGVVNRLADLIMEDEPAQKPPPDDRSEEPRSVST